MSLDDDLLAFRKDVLLRHLRGRLRWWFLDEAAIAAGLADGEAMETVFQRQLLASPASDQTRARAFPGRQPAQGGGPRPTWPPGPRSTPAPPGFLRSLLQRLFPGSRR